MKILSKTKSILVVLLALITTSINAQENTLNDNFRKYEIATFDSRSLKAHAESKRNDFITIPFQLSKRYKWDLELTADKVFSDDYVKNIGGNVSNRNTLKLPMVLRGFDESNDIKATITVNDNFLYGTVETANDVIYFEPLITFDPSAAANQVVIYSQSDIIEKINGTCAAHVSESKKDQLQFTPTKDDKNNRSAGPCRQVDLAVANDHTMRAHHGSDQAVINFNAGVMANVNTDYDDSFVDEVRFVIVETYIAQSEGQSSWGPSSNPNTLLDNFTDWGNGSGFSNPFDMASLWTRTDFDGSTIGLAWVGQSWQCVGRYHVLQHYPGSASGLRNLVSHEIGHNFSLGHYDPQPYNWIMSPSVGGSTQWRPESISALNAYISQANASCLGACTGVPPGGGGTPPVANFDGDVTSECDPLEVTFIDLSTNTPTAWSWQFQNGTPGSSTQQNPVVEFPGNGNYRVTLTASNDDGSNQRILNVGINDAGNPPNASFTSSVSGFTATFDNNTTNANTYTWAFGDGQNSTSANPTHSYASAGTYSVTLTAVGDCGTDTDIRTVEITDQVNAAFTSTITSICFGEQVSFTNQSSSNSTNFSWEFEGGIPSTSTAENPTVTYNGEGTFNARLTVSGGGTSDSELKTNYVTVNGAPNATFSSTIDGYSVDFDNNTTGGTSYSWAFGDGATSTAPNPSHIYSSAGSYSVTLTSVNDCGSDNFTATILIADEVIADFTAIETSGCAGDEFQFTSTSSGNITGYLWEFADGTPSTSTDENPSVIFNAPGAKSVKLTVSNSLYSDEKFESTFISITTLPNARFEFDVNESEVTFDNNTTNGLFYFWDFGDGNMSTDANPTHTYSSGGDYEVTLRSENACEEGQITKTVTIEADIIARFTASSSEICPSESVTFTNNSQGSIVSYLWEFEGGSPATSSAENPIVSYAQAGSFDVKLTVSDGTNSDIENKVNSIAVNTTPSSSFESSINAYNVNFTNTSDNASSYEWNFGDGENSSIESPTHTFDAPGSYLVTLLASNNCDENQSTETVEIQEVLSADFELSSALICAGSAIQFNDNSEGSIVSYLWEFEGGTPASSTIENPEITYSESGSYDVKLTITSSFGSTDVKTLTNEVIVSSGPKAEFSYTQNELTFSFTDLSQNSNSLQWDFGDGNTSTENNPVHTFASEDNYIVTLTVVGECGEDVSTIDLPVFNQLLANFMATETAVCSGQEVELIDLSSGNPTEWEWNIMGEEMINIEEQNPMIILEEPGTYTVELTVRNSEEENSKTVQQYIEVLPIAEAAFNFTFNELEVIFENSSKNGESYLWDFGDGTTSLEKSPRHDYENEGEYLVMLQVVNECSTEEFEQTVGVFNRLVVGFDSDVSSTCTSSEIQFTDKSSGNASSWEWSFPGGTPSVSNERNPKVSYTESGQYDVILTVNSETEEVIETKAKYITVSDAADASFEYVVDKNVVTFTNTSENAEAYFWNFDSEEINPVYTFDEEKAYEVILLSSNGCSVDKETKIIDLYEEAGTYANLGITSNSYCLGDEISFLDLSSEDITEWSWSFPGGSPSQSVEKNPRVMYEELGTFNVELTVSNGFNVRTVIFEDYISMLEQPIAGFEVSQENNKISLINTATSYTSIKWFVNGQLLGDEIDEYLFVKNGEYELTQVVSNACSEDEASQMIVVDVFPTAGFSLDGTKGCAPLTINFESKFTDNTSEVIWFLEGSEFEEYDGLNPEVTYNTPGTYGVTVVATNEFGSDTITLNNVIEVIEAPQVAFDYRAEDVNVLFTAIVGDYDKLLWDFGDGTTSSEEDVSHTYEEKQTYEVTLTVYSGNCVSVFTDDVILQTSNVNDIEEFGSFKVFPNPANQLLNIEFSGIDDVESIELIDQLGRRIWTKSLDKGAESTATSDISRFTAGQYFVALRIKGQKPVYRKLVIIR